MHIDLKEYRAFSSSAFTGDHLLLHIPRRIRTVTEESGVWHIALDAIVCKKEPIVISALMLGRTFRFTGDWVPMTMTLACTGEDTLRIRLGEVQKSQPMLVREPEPLPILRLEETADCYLLCGGKMRIVLYKNPYRLEVWNVAGQLLYKQYNDDLHNVSNDRRRGHKEGEDDTTDAQREALSFPGFECFPFGKVQDLDTGASCFCESVETRYDESFYGFGERFSSLNKKGQELLNWTINPVGVSNSKAYKPVPFFISSRGYGVYYNTPRKIRFSMCDYFFKAYDCQVEDDLLDIFLFVGSTPEILKAYSGLTGTSAVPPKWAFGIWMSRNCYRTQKEVEQVAEQLREQQLPCDVMHIDWAYCKTFDYDFAFDSSRFPDVPAMAQHLLDKGIKLSVWQLPYIKQTADTYEQAAANGYLARHPNGMTADVDAKEGVIDFSSPDAGAWYQEKLRDLLRQGIRVIKTDFGENAQDCYLYENCDGKDMHNLYPLFYNKLAYEACQEVWQNDSLVWGRSAYAGGQRYPVCWGGDSDSDYNGMYHSLRGGLSLGLSGFPFWSHDVGGYFCTPDPDVYIRWMQFGMLSPLVRFHGTSPREPWAFGEEAVRVYQSYAALRYSLMEYLYSEARRCVQDCTPMLRALVLDFPDDPMTANMDDEYLLGRNLLVAPVFSTDTIRRVYLPAGTAWLELHSQIWYSGGQTVLVAVPLEIMPIFFRGGTATPLIQPMQYVDQHPITEMRWEICPVQDSSDYDLHTDQFDIRFRYAFDGVSGVGQINIQGGERLQNSFHINCPDVKRLFVNGREMSVAYEENQFVFVKETK